MRIAIISSWYPTEKDPLYGIFIQTQSKALSEKHDVDVLLLERGIIPKTKVIYNQQLTIYQKRCFYLPNRNESLLKIWAHQYYLLFKENHKKKKYDIIHVHDHYGAYAGWYINQKMGIRYVVTIHNSFIQNLTLINWKQAYLPKVLNHARQVIAVGYKLRETLESYFTSHQVIILPNVIDTEKFKPTNNKNSTDPFKFLFIGDLDDNKGVIRLLQAFSKMKSKDTHLHIIGRGPLKSEADIFIEKNGLKARVLLQGQLPNKELPEIYNSAHVYVSLSEDETFGITILEAMSCGLPIIYTQSGGPEHIVSDHGSVMTSIFDISKISKSLDEIKFKYSEIDRTKIRQHVLDNYSSKSVIRTLEKIYKTCINEA